MSSRTSWNDTTHRAVDVGAVAARERAGGVEGGLRLRRAVVADTDGAQPVAHLGVPARRNRDRAWRPVQRGARVVTDERSSEQSMAGRSDYEQIGVVAVRNLVKATPGRRLRTGHELRVDAARVSFP